MKTERRIEKRPLLSFLTVLGILFLLIIAGNLLRKPKPAVTAEPPVKRVATYTIGTAPKLTVQAQIDKSGVIKIVAQTGGIVSAIHTTEGQAVKQGTWLVSLASNYQGGNAAAVSRQIAQTQYKNVLDTFDMSKELISKQKEIAEKAQDNSEEMREVTIKSVEDTRTLLDLNEDILSTYDANLAAYEATDSAGSNSTLILATRQLKAQYMAAINQMRTAIRSGELSTDEDKPPMQIANLTKDIALKQLEVQEKALELGREVSRLQVTLAQINEGVFHPAAPFAGTVERIHVRIGQAVNPGTVLATFAGNSQNMTAFVMVPAEVATKISKIEPAVLSLPQGPLELTPTHVSSEATDGLLYSVIFTIPATENVKIADKSFFPVQLPIGYPDSGTTMPFVPIDSVYQTKSESFVFIIKDGKATSLPVTLGSVTGRFVQVEKGLGTEEIILDRSVINGEKVQRRET